ncbi:MAG TPA: lanthionine synthetase C family protein [Candidatus Angelobacter sp.]|nr:lanthionine synthetase C family protein [Candidatus Angelobacter sp.]
MSHLKCCEATGNFYLSEGSAGISLFFAYLHAAALVQARDLALDCLAPSVDALAARSMTASFAAGLTGITWTVEHLNRLLGDSTNDLGSEIDLALEAYLKHSPWNHHFDLMHGLVGIGVYCLERAEVPTARRCLELIVARLSELVESSSDGLCWHTHTHLLSPQRRQAYPQGYYNLGPAHGVPGVIALLGKIYASGISQKETRWLLEGAVRWLLRQRLPATAPSSFAALNVPGRSPESCRLAWCYGDAGVAATLLLAARCVGEPSWEREALAIGRRAASRNQETCGVVDACFCHGSSGLAHIFNRLFQATHDEVFALASRHWTERTLQFSSPGNGPAGYRIITPNHAGGRELQEKYGVLMGIAGIGLSLIAATSAVEPNWDRIFLLDIPPLPAS